MMLKTPDGYYNLNRDYDKTYRDLVEEVIFGNWEITKEQDALYGVNKIQEFLKVFKREKNRLIEELEHEGWKIEFDSRINVSNKTMTATEVFFGDTFRDVRICKATKEVGEDKEIVITKKAQVAPGDIGVNLLGEYLALARVYTAIKEE